MALSILTSRCFFLCERITAITLEEVDIGHMYHIGLVQRLKNAIMDRSSRPSSQRVETYNLNVHFIPLNQPNSREDECVSMNVSNLEEAKRVFCEIVAAIRDQNPDDVWINELVNRMLSDQNPKIS